MPSAVCSAQLRQAPPHAWSQHTLSTQWLLAHSSVAAHGWPFAFLPQLPFRQACPATQSALLEQRLMQALFAQRKGSQFCIPGARQLPRPLQVPAVLRRSPLHAGMMQMVWGAKRAQPPMPSQAPVVPQVCAVWARQTLCGSAAPASIGKQVPPRPCWSQLTQAPRHATLQQSPSVQNPDLHSLSRPHTAPLGFSPQLPFTHRTPPPAQSALDRQVVSHLFVAGSQLYGAQTVAGPDRQRP